MGRRHARLRGAAPDGTAVWGQLLAVELIAEEVSREFEDEAVVPEPVRAAMDDARTELETLARETPAIVGEMAAPALDERVADLLRRGVRRDLRLYL